MAAATVAASPDAEEVYDPNSDVKRVAEFFKTRYGDLEQALQSFDPDSEFDLCSFEAALRKWGVQVDNVVELFGHIDVDWSGTISMHELFQVLELPMQEAKAREEQRLKNEVHRIYEQIAKSLRARYGTVQDYFERDRLKQGTSAEGSGVKDLSRARFGQLLRDLGLDVDAPSAQRVFSDIDKNSSGSVSLQELQAALNFILARQTLSDIVKHLRGKYGSVKCAFDELPTDVMGRSSSVRAPPSIPAFPPMPTSTPASATASTSLTVPVPPLTIPAPAAAAGGGGAGGAGAVGGGGMGRTPSTSSVTAGGVGGGLSPRGDLEVPEAKFMNFVRRLEVTDVLKEDEAKSLHAFLKPFTMEQLFNELTGVEEEEKAQEKRVHEEERRQKEKEHRDAKKYNSRYYAQADLKSWEEIRPASLVHMGYEDCMRLGLAKWQPAAGFTILPGGAVEDATRRWSARARAGASRSQLKDYISVLETRVHKMEQDLEKDRRKLQTEEQDVEVLREYLGPQWQYQARGSPTGSPLSPSTPFPSWSFHTPNSRAPATPGLANASGASATAAFMAGGVGVGGAGGAACVGQGLRAVPVSKEVQVLRSERLVQAASVGDFERIQRLLSVKTDPNCEAWGGVTPLMAASKHGQLSSLEALLAAGADLSMTDQHGHTALDHARKQPILARQLKAYGGRTGQELASDAEALARRLRIAGDEKQRIDAHRKELPSEEVLRQARRRRQVAEMPSGTGGGGAASGGHTRSIPGWPAWPPWPTSSPSPSVEVAPSPDAGSTSNYYSVFQQKQQALAADRCYGPRKQVQVLLPDEAMGTATRAFDPGRKRF